MSAPVRYTKTCGSGMMYEVPNGEYILFSDHNAYVDKLIAHFKAQLAIVTAERDLALDQLQCEDSDERSELPFTNP